MSKVAAFLDVEIVDLKRNHPEIVGFLESHGLIADFDRQSLAAYLGGLPGEFWSDCGLDLERLLDGLEAFLVSMDGLKNGQAAMRVQRLTIKGGRDKNGQPENIDLTLEAGTISSIVGPTGSGKSRLLADIEWMAQNDTPTGRRILVNDEIPDIDLRFSLEHKLVAQLSQNMNFVIDTNVENFIAMHAASRMQKSESIVSDVINQANALTGESFRGETPITSLSGGQSRALMIADVAFLSTSPVVLIDEIENAGIDRKAALELLTSREKIVVMATHDPILALMADRRLVIGNGAIRKIIKTSEAEKSILSDLEMMDSKIQSLRSRLRAGEEIAAI